MQLDRSYLPALPSLLLLRMHDLHFLEELSKCIRLCQNCIAILQIFTHFIGHNRSRFRLFRYSA